MRNIKMLVFDLDGTLLRDDKTISDYTKSVLCRCREAGIKVAYATGRGGSASVVAPSEHFDARITQNGGIVTIGDTVVRKCHIPYQSARPLLLACDRQGLKTSTAVSGMHYTNFVAPDHWPEVKNYAIADFARHELDAEALHIIIESPDDVAFIEEHMPAELYMTVTRDALGMIMHQDATKSRAVAELARIWGINQSEIAAFGDDANDIDMLKYAGVGVAMGNALDEVKAAADCICGGNDEDGAAVWIIYNVVFNKPRSP